MKESSKSHPECFQGGILLLEEGCDTLGKRRE